MINIKDHPTTFFELFQTEVYYMSLLSHPCIVELYCICVSPPMLIMELLKRGSLSKELRRLYKANEKPSLSFRLNVALDVAYGVAYMHSLVPSIIHRDLKSSNILLTEENRAKIADFGVAMNIIAPNLKSCPVSNILWLAPEILEEKEYGVGVDVYSYGIVLSELLMCRRPYSDNESANTYELKAKIIDGLRPSIGQLQGEFDEEYCELMKMCWDGCPSKRPTFGYIIKILERMREKYLQPNFDTDCDNEEISKTMLENNDKKMFHLSDAHMRSNDHHYYFNHNKNEKQKARYSVGALSKEPINTCPIILENSLFSLETILEMDDVHQTNRDSPYTIEGIALANVNSNNNNNNNYNNNADTNEEINGNESNTSGHRRISRSLSASSSGEIEVDFKGICCMIFVKKGSHVWAGTGDGHIIIRSADEYDVQRIWRAHDRRITKLIEGQLYIWSCSEDGFLRIWCKINFRQIEEFKSSRKSKFSCLAKISNGKGCDVIFAGTDTGEICSWLCDHKGSISTGRKWDIGKPISSLMVSEDWYLWVGSSDGLNVIPLKRNTLSSTFSFDLVQVSNHIFDFPYPRRVTAILYDKDNEKVWTCSDDNVIRILEIKRTGKQTLASVKIVNEQRTQQRLVELSQVGKYIVGSGWKSSTNMGVVVWGRNSCKYVGEMGGFCTYLKCLCKIDSNTFWSGADAKFAPIGVWKLMH